MVREENLEKEIQKWEPAQVRKAEEKLPYCTLAVSAGHASGSVEEEPRDDGRAGDDERE